MSRVRLQQQGRGGTGKKLAAQPARKFAFRLCLELGEVHPDYLLPRLTSRQLSEWMAYFDLRPFGQDYTDQQIAQVACILANANRKPYSEPHKLEDFLPHKEREQSPGEMKAILRSVIGGHSQKH